MAGQISEAAAPAGGWNPRLALLLGAAMFVLVDVTHFAAAYARTLESAMSSAITKTTDETGGPTGVPREPRP